jgi:hypothetical protein
MAFDVRLIFPLYVKTISLFLTAFDLLSTVPSTLKTKSPLLIKDERPSYISSSSKLSSDVHFLFYFFFSFFFF